jgi:hypothetical protein
MFPDLPNQTPKKIVYQNAYPRAKSCHSRLYRFGISQNNEQLRAGAVRDRTRHEINILTCALEELPNFQGDVFRGAAVEEGLLRQYRRVGEVITERAFVSASRSPLKAFSGNVRFYIISKRSKEIGRWSTYPDEEEVLFPPNTRFKVLEYGRDGNEIEIFLEEL